VRYNEVLLCYQLRIFDRFSTTVWRISGLLALRYLTLSTRMWAMPNVMAALPNTGGALCSTPQRLADAHYWSAVQ